MELIAKTPHHEKLCLIKVAEHGELQPSPFIVLEQPLCIALRDPLVSKPGI